MRTVGHERRWIVTRWDSQLLELSMCFPFGFQLSVILAPLNVASHSY